MNAERLRAVPISQQEANAFINAHHRHHCASLISVFRVAVARGDQIVGVAMVSIPVARMLCDGLTLEVSRLCTLDSEDARHAASKLYAICWRIAREMGYQRLLTYTLADETGVSLVAAGWRVVYHNKGGAWVHTKRPSHNRHPLGPKTLWEMIA